MLCVTSLGFLRVAFLVGPLSLPLTGICSLLRGVQSTKVSKVKGHADDDMVAGGRFGLKTGLTMILLTGLLILGDFGFLI